MSHTQCRPCSIRGNAEFRSSSHNNDHNVKSLWDVAKPHCTKLSPTVVTPPGQVQQDLLTCSLTQPEIATGRSCSAGRSKTYCWLYDVATPEMPVSHTRFSREARQSLLNTWSQQEGNGHKPEGYWLFRLKRTVTFCANN